MYKIHFKLDELYDQVTGLNRLENNARNIEEAL